MNRLHFERIGAALALGLLGLVGGCASARAAGTTSPPYRAVERIAENPPRLIGKDADLTIEHGALAGRLEGGTYHVNITPDSATGQGPLGPIDVHIKHVARGYDLSGLWNGGQVHFLVGESGARGHLLKQISAEDRGYESCQYDIQKLRRQPGYSGLSECLGDDHPLRFEVQPRLAGDMSQEQNAILLLAYFAAPPPVREI